MISKTNDVSTRLEAGAAHATLANAQKALGDRGGACASYRRAHQLLKTATVKDDDEMYFVRVAAAETAGCAERR